MGLDQYATFREKTGEADFYWRKHSRLQEFMEDIWYNKLGRADEFNCKELVLTKEMLQELLDALEKNNLPKSDGGFFYGHEFQDESAKEYHNQDIKFCKEGLKAIEDGMEVVYECWY